MNYLATLQRLTAQHAPTMSWKSFTEFKSKPSIDVYPNLPDHITWTRLFLGLSYGTLLGFIESKQNTNLQGVAGIISGLLVIIFLPMGYINLYLTAQTETYKNLYIQGVNNGLALMLLIWITAFTIIHNEEGFALTKATLQTFADVVVSDDKSATNSMVEEGLSDSLHSEF